MSGINFLEKNFEITNADGYIVVKDNVSLELKRYKEILGWSETDLSIEVSNGLSVEKIYMKNVVSPVITDLEGLALWMDSLVLT